MKWVPLSSTHQFHPKGLLLFSPQNPSVQHTPQFYTKDPSVLHQKALSSTPSVQHQKALSSTPLSFTQETPQFNTPLRRKLCWNEGFLVRNWGMCGTEGVSVLNWGVFGVELRSVLNWGVIGVELRVQVFNWRVFGVELGEFVCWKGVVLVWNRCVELRGSMWNWGVLKWNF